MCLNVLLTVFHRLIHLIQHDAAFRAITLVVTERDGNAICIHKRMWTVHVLSPSICGVNGTEIILIGVC